jgi:anti-sigma factor RsiW
VIFSRHVTDNLAPYVDGRLDERARSRVDAHLAACGDCRRDLEEVRRSDSVLRQIPLFEAPESLWVAIETAAGTRPEIPAAAWSIRRYAVAALVVVSVLAGYWRYTRTPVAQWKVVVLSGSPLAGNEPVAAAELVPTGEWIETDSTSRARVEVGSIGSVEIAPDSRVRLVSSGTSEHRLALGHGQINAKILAPPRLFFVDTPSVTAVDLGCEYRLRCDRAGTGTLNVSQGWVALEWRGMESLVPAGASCHMRPGRRPGTPWFDDASPELADALERFDFNADSAPADLETILARSRARDTLTLWHLLSRVETSDRVRVYERMAELAPPPPEIAREKLLSLDPQSLARWKDELAWTW